MNYYVDPDSGNDANSGTSRTQAKEHLMAALELIAAPITEITNIYVKYNATNAFTGNVNLQGIAMLGDSSIRLRIMPADFSTDPETVHWNEDNWKSGQYDPYNPNNGQGVFNILGEKPVIFNMTFNFENCRGLEFWGVRFGSLKPFANGGIVADGGSQIVFKYCRFEGPTVALLASGASNLTVENCLFLENYIAAISAFSLINFTGNNLLMDPVKIGVFLMMQGKVIVEAWKEQPEEYNTLEIRTTKIKKKEYAAIKAQMGSILASYDEDFFPVPIELPGTQIKIVNDYKYVTFPASYFGILLQSNSMLYGNDNVVCQTLQMNSLTDEEYFPLPYDQSIVVVASEGAIVAG